MKSRRSDSRAAERRYASRDIVCADVRDLPFTLAFPIAILPFKVERKQRWRDELRALSETRGVSVAKLARDAVRAILRARRTR